MSEHPFTPSPDAELKIVRPDGTPLVSIRFSDGRLTYGEGYDPDEAARIFWRAMSYHAPGAREAVARAQS